MSYDRSIDRDERSAREWADKPKRIELQVSYLRGAWFGIPFQALISACEQHCDSFEAVAATIRDSYPKLTIELRDGIIHITRNSRRMAAIKEVRL